MSLYSIFKMAHKYLAIAFRSCVPALEHRNVGFQFSRHRSFIRRKLVSREECLKMSRTSKSDFQSILMRMNLNEQWPDFKGSLAGIQSLESNCSTLSHLYIRPGNSFMAHHRIELIVQRLRFMSKMGLTPKEKLNLIKRNPPLLALVNKKFGDSTQMVYVRGILREDSFIKYLFYPVFPRTFARKPVLDERLDFLANSMGTTREQILHTAMSLPCFSINTASLKEYQDKVIHLHLKMLPRNFDLDAHTVDVYPPILSQKLNNLVHGQNDFPNLKGIKFPELFDLSYNASNGAGCAEDLSEFLLRSHCEELQYAQPVNFKKKRIPRKHRRFSSLKAFETLLLS